MKTLSFKNKDKMPIIGLGTWLSRSNEVYNAVLDALNAGYRHIDCAYIYGNEVQVGKALQEAFSSNLVKREDVFITSKLWNSSHEPEQVEIALRKSLKNLQLDYLDLYLMHWPIAFATGHDQASTVSDLVPLSEIPLSETWKAMIALKEKGLAKHIGVSNFSTKKIQQLIDETSVAPEVNQIEIHPYLQQNELVGYCQQQDILVTAYSPLGSSKMGKRGKGLSNEEIILDIAKKHNCTPAQVLLAWNMQRDIIVIPKSVHTERIKENFNATQVKLDADDMQKISTLDRHERLSQGAFSVFPGGPYTLKNIWDE